MSCMLARLMRGVVLAGAWLFIMTSIAGISWLAITLARSNFTGTVYLFFTATVDQRTEGGLGLSYHAWFGFLLAVAELTVIVVSIVCSCRRGLAARRLDGAIRLYTLGASHLLLSVAIMAACWACVFLRAVWGWTPQRGEPTSSVEATSAVTPS